MWMPGIWREDALRAFGGAKTRFALLVAQRRASRFWPGMTDLTIKRWTL
jgi:hypothetical protein